MTHTYGLSWEVEGRWQLLRVKWGKQEVGCEVAKQPSPPQHCVHHHAVDTAVDMEPLLLLLPPLSSLGACIALLLVLCVQVHALEAQLVLAKGFTEDMRTQVGHTG